MSNNPATGATNPQPYVPRDPGNAEMFQSDRAAAPEMEQNRSETLRSVPECSETFRLGRNDKTNPRPVDAESFLSPKQLFAARALAGGRTATQVAQSLSTSRQTINRWRRDPQFAREVKRLHDVIMREAVRKSSTPAQRERVRPPLPRIVPRSNKPEATAEEEAEFERAYQAEMIRKYGKEALEIVRFADGKMTFHDLE